LATNKLGSKLREIREKNKLGSLKEFAPLLEISNNTLATYELGTVLPDVDFLINFCEETGTDFGELLDLRIQDSPATQGDIAKASKYLLNRAGSHLNIANKLSESIPNYSLDNQLKKMDVMQQSADYQHSLYIEHYPDVRAAAGAGQVTETDQFGIMVAVNASEWRARVGLNTKNIKMITVYGDSMSPTLSHGDQVMIDTACHAFVDDAIYALLQGDLIRVKRIKLNLDGTILVKSDNENGFQPEKYSVLEAADFNILGKVLPFKFGQFKM
jgi:phage repressor protein C with HTH and peptisase S24 domain